MMLDATNAYLGAWVTAGFAIGGVAFSALQAIATAISKYFVEKHKNDSELRIEQEKTKQERIAAKEKHRNQIKGAFQNYFTQTALVIYQEKQSALQVKAYAELINELNDVGFNSTIWEIQENIKKGHFTSADDTFHKYLPQLKEEETHLLSQLESHSPKEHTIDFEDPQVEQGNLQKRKKPRGSIR